MRTVCASSSPGRSCCLPPPWPGRQTCASPVCPSPAAAPVRAPFAFDLVGARWKGSGAASRSARAPTAAASVAGQRCPQAEDVHRPGRLGRRAGLDRFGARRPAARAGAVQRAARDLRDGRRGPEPGCRCAPRAVPGAADDHLARRLGRRREPPPRPAALRARRADGVRAPHGHAERLRRGRRAGDHPLDLHLPRALERLERHRLQLPRRSPTGASTRAATAASTAPWSARTRWASTPAASASP